MRIVNSLRGHPFRYSVGLCLIFNSLFLALVVIKPGSHRAFIIADDVGQALGWLLGTLLCLVHFTAFRRSDFPPSTHLKAKEGLRRWASFFIALGIFCQFLGQVIYTYYDIHHWTNFPSWADAGYLSTFPFLCLGILLLPTYPLTSITRSRVLLDGVIIMGTVITFSWYFVLGPTMLQGNETTFAKFVGSAYPFFDLVLIFIALRLALRSLEPGMRLTARLLISGLIIIVITDSIYDYQTLQNVYVNGWQDAGWPIGYMLLGLSAQSWNTLRWRQKNAPDSMSAKKDVSSSMAPSLKWHVFLPYVLIPAVGLLVIYVRRSGVNSPLAQGVYIGGGMLVGLVIVRQLFVVREMLFYNRQLHKTEQELHEKNEALHQANQQLEDQTAQLEAAYAQERQLNELKDQFLLNVNHELRTPLTEIHGYLNLLLEYRGQLDEDTQTTFIDHAMRGSEELLHLVNNALDTLHGEMPGEAPHLADLCVAEIVADVIAIFDPQKIQDHPLTLDIPPELHVKADQQYLHQILLNLLANAFKYSPAGTALTISAAPVESPLRDTPSGSEQTCAQEVCICVQDAGPGIPPEEIPLLFGKFVRLKRDMNGSVRGTGLGLYISKHLVESMGGRIWVESTGIPEEGSRFSFTVPAFPATCPTKDSLAKPENPAMRS